MLPVWNQHKLWFFDKVFPDNCQYYSKCTSVWYFLRWNGTKSKNYSQNWNESSFSHQKQWRKLPFAETCHYLYFVHRHFQGLLCCGIICHYLHCPQKSHDTWKNWYKNRVIYDKNSKLGMLNPRTIQYDLHFLYLYQVIKLYLQKDIPLTQVARLELLSQRALLRG